MSEYRTDEETVEELRRWWSENGMTIAVTVVVVFGGVFGWNWYQGQQAEQASEASDLFVQWEEQRRDGADAASGAADALLASDPGSGYAAFVRFEAARAAMAEGDIDEARASLQSVLALSLPDAFTDLARLRLARVELEAGNHGAAHAQLDSIRAGETMVAVQELRGDTLLAEGRMDEALAAWEAGLQTGSGGGPVLQMKVDDLTSRLTATEAGTEAEG